MTDLISRADALAYPIRIDHYDKKHGNLHFVLGIESVMEYIENLPSAEAVPIHEDGTLEVKVPNAQKVGRVLVMDTDSHIGGGLFYPDEAVSREDYHNLLMASNDIDRALREYQAKEEQASIVDITQRDLCADISCEDCPFMKETCKLMDYVAYAEAVQGWIPCDEEMPIDSEEVIASVYWKEYGDSIIAYGHYSARFDKWRLYSDTEGELTKGYEVTAWMPLPTPYKGGEDA